MRNGRALRGTVALLFVFGFIMLTGCGVDSGASDGKPYQTPGSGGYDYGDPGTGGGSTGGG